MGSPQARIPTPLRSTVPTDEIQEFTVGAARDEKDCFLSDLRRMELVRLKASQNCSLLRACHPTHTICIVQSRGVAEAIAPRTSAPFLSGIHPGTSPTKTRLCGSCARSKLATPPGRERCNRMPDQGYDHRHHPLSAGASCLPGRASTARLPQNVPGICGHGYGLFATIAW